MVISVRAYLLLLSAMVAERMFELVLSRRNARRAFAHGALEVARGQYLVTAVFHALFPASCAIEVLTFDRPFWPMIGWAALAGAAMAQALRYWTVTTLGERWNVRVIVIPGAPPVTGGPFRFIRHPNYLAVVLEMLCVPMIHGCWMTALVFSLGNGALLAWRIPLEERALGERYAAAFASRPRFIARLRRG